MKRRALVLTDEIARHPFRASLPPHVCRGTEPMPARKSEWRLEKSDMREFVSTYCASFVAVAVFFA